MPRRTTAQPQSWTRQTGPVLRRSRRRRAVLRLMLAALLLSLVAAGVWLLAFSSVLELRTTRVAGVQGAAADAVLKAANLPLGQPLARVDTGAAIAAVSTLPWVDSVTATRRWPDSIVLTVSQREPVAMQKSTGRGVDATGRAFEPVSELPATLISIDAPDTALPTAVAAWLALPPDLAAQVTEVSARTRDDIAFELQSGSLVRWGNPDDVELKAQVLRLLMREPALVYNVSAPDVPTVIGRSGV